MVGTWDASNLSYVVISEHLGLGLVHPQILYPIKAVQLLYSLLHLCLRVGQDEHVVSEGQQVPPVDHLPQLLSGTQCLFQVDVEQHRGQHTSLDHS